METHKVPEAGVTSDICRSFVLELQKLYGRRVPKVDMPVVEATLFAVCLEDSAWEGAEACHRTVITSRDELNNIHISSPSEFEQTLAPLTNADVKASRIHGILHYLSDSTCSSNVKSLRAQTLEQAAQTLMQIRDVSPFVRDFVLHEMLGQYVVCLDDSMWAAARWLGLVPLTVDRHEASEFLKGGVTAEDVSQFCYLLRCLATDLRFIDRYADMPDREPGMDQVLNRLAEIQQPPRRKRTTRPAPSLPSELLKNMVGRHSTIARENPGILEIAVIDLETTGFSPDAGDRIIEIGIVFLNESLEQLRTFQSLVNPERRVRGSVHGISNEDLEGQPTFSELCEPLLDQLRNTCCLVAHNISFEKRFLRAEFSSQNIHLPRRLHDVCTMKAAKELRIGSDQRLQTLVRELGIEVAGPSHRAIPDALATAELLRRLHRSNFRLPELRQVEWVRIPSGELAMETSPSLDNASMTAAELTQAHLGSCNAASQSSRDHGRVIQNVSYFRDSQQGIASGANVDGVNDRREVKNVSRPVEILISKLGLDGKIAQQAAEALMKQARRHREKLEEAVDQMAPFLHSDNYNVRGAVANVLGHIGTQTAIRAIARAFESSSAEDLATQCEVEWEDKSLSEWYAQAIGETRNKLTAKTLVSLLSSKTIPDAAKAGVMMQLSDFDLDDLKVKLPRDIVEVLEAFASSDDPNLAEGAINMLGSM